MLRRMRKEKTSFEKQNSHVEQQTPEPASLCSIIRLVDNDQRPTIQGPLSSDLTFTMDAVAKFWFC
jgi:hypothetical protein